MNKKTEKEQRLLNWISNLTEKLDNLAYHLEEMSRKTADKKEKYSYLGMAGVLKRDVKDTLNEIEVYERK